MKLEDIIDAYLEAAEWTEWEPILLEYGHDIEADPIPWTPNLDLSDIEALFESYAELVSQYPLTADQFGHDLWLTRNGHGAGFWDRGLGKLGDELTDMADSLGSVNVFLHEGMLFME